MPGSCPGVWLAFVPVPLIDCPQLHFPHARIRPNSTMNTFEHPFTRQSKNRIFSADLPRELRDLVYSHLWWATPHIRPSFRSYRWPIFKVYYGDTNTESPCRYLPRWLLLSKGVCQEGIEDLQRHPVWTCVLDEDLKIRDGFSALTNPSSATRVNIDVSN